MSRKRNKPEALFNFVQSLTWGEFLRIRTYAHHFNGSGNQSYLKILVHLRESDSYDPQQLSSLFPGQNVARLKRYAFQFALKGLRESTQSHNKEVRDQITDIENLLVRGSYIEAQALIFRAKIFCQKRELFGYLKELYDLDFRLITHFLSPSEQKKAVERLNLSTREHEAVSANLQQYKTVFQNLYAPIRFHIRETRTEPSQLLKVFFSELIRLSDIPPVSGRAQLLNHTMRAFAERRAGCWDETWKHCYASLDLFESCDWLRYEYFSDYVNTVELVGYSHILNKDVEGCKSCIQKLEEVISAQPGTEKRYFNIVLSLVFQAYRVFQTSTFLEKGNTLLSKVNRTDFENLAPFEKLRLAYVIGTHFTLMGKASLTSEWIDLIRPQLKQNLRLEYQIVIQIFELLIAYEKWDPESLQTLSRSILRKYRSLSDKFPGMVYLVNQLRNQLKYPTQTDSRASLNKVKEKFIQKRESSPEEELPFLEIFDKWLAVWALASTNDRQ